MAARDAEIARLSGISAEKEREIWVLSTELARERELGAEHLRALTALGSELDRLRTNALAQATRIRLQALREAAAVNRIASGASRYQGGGVLRVEAALEAALDRIAADWDAFEAEEGEEAGVPDPVLVEDPRVSVDVGPFEDFAQLVSFEDAANAIGATGEISIRRFSEGRAQIDVSLSEPVDILRELEERCDLQFKVRSRRDGEIILDVDE